MKKNTVAGLDISGISANGKDFKLLSHPTMGTAVFQTQLSMSGKRSFDQQVSKWYERKGCAINKMLKIALDR
jgi:hypothetical protein